MQSSPHSATCFSLLPARTPSVRGIVCPQPPPPPNAFRAMAAPSLPLSTPARSLGDWLLRRRELHEQPRPRGLPSPMRVVAQHW